MTVPMSVSLMPAAAVADVVELAVLAEELGLARCWVYDEGLVTRDVYIALTAIAAQTQRIPLGPGITNPFVRHPGATAAAIASLDEFSGGRAFVGLGAGGGLTLDPMAIKRSRPLTAVSDMVTCLRRLFAGERVDHEGHAFSFQNAKLDYARPDIEICLAGRGPKMTALGGDVADGFNLSYIHKDLLGSHARSLRRFSGDRPFRITYSTMIALTDEEYEAARAQLTFRLVDSPSEVKDMIGMTPGDVASVRAALAEGGPSAAARHIDPDWVSAFVISGTAAECAAELHTLMDTNDIDEFQLPVLEIEGAAAFIERSAEMFRP
ncbi:MAG: LLM class flavin-dependent oxidoreductase [Acidimicrobiales bacterium]|nr:LLM class flavin-dependent oxidoreductase [Acidimicrobiales bacterium]MDG2219466.1 LLM class flavin-dependent oxidoreductase [Acidimicrobiales bacterium]